MNSNKLIGRVAFLAIAATCFGALPIIQTLIPSANSQLTSISFESVNQNRVILGALASRSQNAQLTRSGASSPFTMSALATENRGPYSYQTDAPYGQTSGTAHSSCQLNVYGSRGCLTQLRESDERAPTGMTFTGNTNGTDTGKTGIIDLTQDGTVNTTPTGGRGANQMANGEYSFAAIFGPEIYSVPFVGTPGQAVTYQWRATGAGDDYEVYGFLVKISSNTGTACTSASGAGTYGLTNPTTTHTVLSYGRGKASAWTTTTGTINESGCFRFRFVGGTYDASGGYYVGGTFRVFDVKLGLAQTLTFTQPADLIRSTSDRTFTAQASSNASGATLVYASDTTALCTVSGTTVTVKANQSGTCTLRVDSGPVGDYGAAPTTYTSFLVQASATRPVSTGGDSISGDAKVCSTLSVDEGSWSNGGETITSTTYQWKRNGVPIIGATNSNYVVQGDDVGTAISYDITKTNSIGSTTATSSSVIPVDTRLSALSTSAGSLSPGFSGCTFSYSASSGTRQITVTASSSDTSTTLTINGSASISGQSSGIISLSAGSNSITVVVTKGSLSSTTTLTINYAQAPTVTTIAPTSLTGTGATLNATVNANGQSTSNIFFEISTNSLFASDTSTVSATPSSLTGFDANSVSASSPLLLAQTTYYVRTFATNVTGTTTSNTFSFTTPAAPFVTTTSAETLTATSARINGTVVGNGDSGGSATSVSFQYSLNSNLSGAEEVSPATNSSIPGGDTSNTSVSVTLSGLQTGRTYFYRIKATNTYGTNFGSILSFTLVDSPTVTTTSVTALGTNSVTLNGSVNANSLTTSSIVFRWGTSSGSLSNSLSGTPTSVTGFSPTSISANLTGLTANTTYYYRLSATNSIGTVLSTPVESFTTATDSRPTATLSAQGNSLLNQPFTVTITFSEAVTGFTSSDLSISGASSGWDRQIAQQISTSLYTVEFRPNTGTPPTAGNFVIALAQNVVLDSASQGNFAATSITVVTSSGVIAPDIAYPSYTISGTRNSAITALIPTNAGGIISSWSINPPSGLPSGLTFSTLNGQFSGTPTTTFTSSNFVVTATNSAGSDSVTVTVVVADSLSVSASPSTPLLPIIAYTPNNVSGVVGSAITSLVATNSGETATAWTVSPSLPTGISINAATGLISGTPSATSISTTYLITAATSANETGTATVVIEVLPPPNSSPSAPTILGGLVSIYSAVTSSANGFTVQITNFDSSFTYQVSVAPTGNVAISTSGLLTVSGLQGQGTEATVTVTTSKNGHSNGTSSVTGRTLSAPPPPSFLVSISPPVLTQSGDVFTCRAGKYEFLRESRTREPARLSTIAFSLVVDAKEFSRALMTFTSTRSTDASGIGEFPEPAEVKFDLTASTVLYPAHCEVHATQENSVSLSASNVLTKAKPNLSWPQLTEITEEQSLDGSPFTATSDIEGVITYNYKVGDRLPFGRYSIIATLVPQDLKRYESVSKSNTLNVLRVNSSQRKLVEIDKPKDSWEIRIPTGNKLFIHPETRLNQNQMAGNPGFGLNRVEIEGNTLIVWPESEFSGNTSVVLGYYSNGILNKITQPLKINPAKAEGLSAAVNSLNSAKLSWNSAAGAESYEVRIDGLEICRTSSTNCDVPVPVGPKTMFTLVSLGRDMSKSETTFLPKVTANFKVESVSFKIGSFELSNSAKRYIFNLAKTLNQLGYSNIVLSGFTDNTGGVNNQRLSRQRANQVLKEFSKILPRSWFSINSFGELNPIDSNSTPEGRSSNRRVEIQVIQN